METKLVKVTPDNFDAALEEACAVIQHGGLVGMPTETVYGLAASAFDEDAVRSIFEAKGRPQDNPIIVHISDYVMLKMVATEFPDNAARLVRAFWPGPLTVILPKTESVAPAVTCGLNTVAIRMPSHPVARELIARSALPIAAPSANLSGKPSPTLASHVWDDMNGRIPLILDGGACEVGIESTVISFVGETPTVLRPGMISLHQIQEYVPNAQMSRYAVEPVAVDEVVESPGLKHKHYAPLAKVTIVKGSLEQFCEFINAQSGAGVFAMCFNGEQDRIDIPSVSYGEADDPASQARRLFATLRALDSLGAQCVFARCPADGDSSLGVFNRLVRAAGFDVVEL